MLQLKKQTTDNLYLSMMEAYKKWGFAAMDVETIITSRETNLSTEEKETHLERSINPLQQNIQVFPQKSAR